MNIISIVNIWFLYNILNIFSWFLIIRITRVNIVLHFRLLNLFTLLIAKVSSLIRSITALEWFQFLGLNILLFQIIIAKYIQKIFLTVLFSQLYLLHQVFFIILTLNIWILLLWLLILISNCFILTLYFLKIIWWEYL